MRRNDFIDNVTCWYDLIEVCDDNGCDYLSDIIDGEYYDEWVGDNVVGWARDYDWTDLTGILTELSDNRGYDYYVYSEWNDRYIPADDDLFDDRKNEVLEYIDMNGEWDDEEDENDCDNTIVNSEDVTDDDPIPDEDFSISEMLIAGLSCIKNINEEEAMLENMVKESAIIF